MVAYSRSGAPEPAAAPKLSHFRSVEQLVQTLDRADLRCGGRLQVDPPSEEGFVAAECPKFDGDDVANIYVFDSHEAMFDYFEHGPFAGADPSGAVGDNWLVSVRLERTARGIARAADGRVIGFGP